MAAANGSCKDFLATWSQEEIKFLVESVLVPARKFKDDLESCTGVNGRVFIDPRFFNSLSGPGQARIDDFIATTDRTSGSSFVQKKKRKRVNEWLDTHAWSRVTASSPEIVLEEVVFEDFVAEDVGESEVNDLAERLVKFVGAQQKSCKNETVLHDLIVITTNSKLSPGFAHELAAAHCWIDFLGPHDTIVEAKATADPELSLRQMCCYALWLNKRSVRGFVVHDPAMAHMVAIHRILTVTITPAEIINEEDALPRVKYHPLKYEFTLISGGIPYTADIRRWLQFWQAIGKTAVIVDPTSEDDSEAQ